VYHLLIPGTRVSAQTSTLSNVSYMWSEYLQTRYTFWRHTKYYTNISHGPIQTP